MREAFDFEHNEIAEVINISVDNSRQLYKRAKEKVATLRHKPVSNSIAVEIAKQFVDHIKHGNLKELIELFNHDISIIGDGGGKAPTITKPIFGQKEVAQFFLKLFDNKNLTPTFSFTEILLQPAIILNFNEKMVSIMVLSLYENKISQVFGILNPDKLSVFKNNSNSLSHN